MPLFLSEADLQPLLSMPDAVEAVDDAFAAWASGDAANHPRQRFFLSHAVFHHMAAALPAKNVVGIKTYTSTGSQNRFYIQLFETQTGELLALLEANFLGQLRTGAATGAAAKHLADPDAAVAAILGTGFQAQSQALALVAALPNLRTIRVFGRDFLRREEFCRALTLQTGVRFEPVASAEAAVRGANAVVTATSAREPILHGEWLHERAFVAAVGANRLTAREIDDETVARAEYVAIDDPEQARTEAAELLLANERRRFTWEKAIPFADIASRRVTIDRKNTGIRLFKSLGIALEDIAVAARAFENARAAGVGREI